MNATLLTIGDELLIGQVVNTNVARLGEQLSALGVTVRRTAVVGDEMADIRGELRRSLGTSDLVLVTGGLGPTHDDITKKAIADELGRPLEFHEDLLAELKQKFDARGRPMAERNRVQAEVPAGFEALHNPVGTAPGLWFAGEIDGVERVIVVLPGVPHEMEALMREAVLPRLAARNGEAAIAQKTLLTVGIGESDLADALGDFSDRIGPDLHLAFLPSYGVVRLRITAFGAARAVAEARLADFEDYVRSHVEEYVFGEDDDTLEAAIGRMLRERGLTLATAESCTGGLLSHRLTNIPGSSDYYCGGAVVYGNTQKIELLKVDTEMMATYGAVSDPVARQMAEGVRIRLNADLGISTTGIAGPGGGTPEKPVGTVWIGYADANGTHAVHLRLTNDRLLNKRLSVTAGLGLIRRQLLRRDRLAAEPADPA
ncbi:MAG: competence/damage-inducible protein A [Rhodothermales bacterium]